MILCLQIYIQSGHKFEHNLFSIASEEVNNHIEVLLLFGILKHSSKQDLDLRVISLIVVREEDFCFKNRVFIFECLFCRNFCPSSTHEHMRQALSQV
jgi:hypothetical protein